MLTLKSLFRQRIRKIEGPWLWMLVPTDQETAEDPTGIKEDYLATASNGSVTETQIATEGRNRRRQGWREGMDFRGTLTDKRG